ncbi:membrane protein [Streptosporangium violaceochromogenes]|nr:membrane protein [Streptosporangium violaceochromogenes]
MSLGTAGETEAAAPGTEAAPTSPTVRERLRAGWGVLLVALIVILVAVAGVLLGGGPDRGRPLDPAGASLSGGKALAQLLRAHGVHVVRVTSAAQAGERSAALGAGNSTLLLSDTSFLGEDEIREISALRADRLVIGPQTRLELLAPQVTATGEVRARSREPGCALDSATRAGSAYMGGMTFGAPPDAFRCYFGDGAPTLVRYVRSGLTTTVVGDGQFMTNQRLPEDGNAALAVNLAGARPAVIWLTAPEAVSGTSARKSLYDLIPPGVKGAAVQLALVVLLLALWQGRRLGPVVVERLPVVVRAAETVEGRARLYRARRARDRAADALRAGFLDRIVPRLGLPPAAGPEATAGAIAERTGQAGTHVGAALYGPPPPDDAGLVALAAYLDMLERQVRES